MSVAEPSCQSRLSAGALRASSRCLRRHRLAGADEYRSHSPMTINGVLVSPLDHH